MASALCEGERASQIRLKATIPAFNIPEMLGKMLEEETDERGFVEIIDFVGLNFRSPLTDKFHKAEFFVTTFGILLQFSASDKLGDEEDWDLQNSIFLGASRGVKVEIA